VAKVNGVPGFTNFKKVNILDTLLIQGNPIGQSVATEDLNITGDWTFQNDVGFSGAIQLEDESGTFQSALFFDIATDPDTLVLTNPVTNGDIDFRTNGSGSVLVNGASPFFDVASNYTLTGTWDFTNSVDMVELDLSGSLTASDATFSGDVGFSQSIQIEDESATFQNVLFYDIATTPDTIVLTNEITNGDIDLRTNGTGQVLVNGANPFFDTAANYTVTGDWIFTQDATFQSNIIAESDLQINATVSFQDSSLAYQKALFYDLVTTPDTIVLTNSITNGDVDVRTNGTGDFLINGTPVGSFLALANDEYITAEDSGATARDVFGINTSDYTVVGNDLLVGTVLKSGTGDEVILQSDAVNVALGFYNSGFSQRGYVGFIGNADLTVANTQTGDDVVLSITGASSMIRLIDDSIGDRLAITRAGRMSLYDVNVQPAIRTQDYTGSVTSGAQLADPNGSLRDIGWNIADITTGNVTFPYFTIDRVGGMILKTDASAYTWQINDLGVGQDGQLWMGANIGSAGDVTITEGGTVTLTWLDGSSLTTGTRTIAPGGVFTVFRRDTDEYLIWGTGIS